MHVREAFPAHGKGPVRSWSPEAVASTVVGELLAPRGVRSSTLYTVTAYEAGKDPPGGRSLLRDLRLKRALEDPHTHSGGRV